MTTAIENSPEPTRPLLYTAFVSYSHAADGKLAPAIQHALHTFAKPWYKLRASRVFRDKTSLSATPALWPSIEQALSDSKWFLYMASPSAAQSSWVRQEIAWWLTHRSCDTMLFLLTDGDLAWNAATNDFDWTRTTAAPHSIAGYFPSEPLYVDLRWARTEGNLSLRHLQFRAAILDIAAPVQGRPKDELDGDDVRQQRKNKRWAWSAGIGLAVLASAATLSAVIAVQQRNEAEGRRQIAFSRQLATQALTSMNEDHLDAALLFALESRNVLTAPSAATESNTFDARSSLLTTLSFGSAPIRSYLRGGGVVAFSPDGTTLAAATAGKIVVWNISTGTRVGDPFDSEGNANSIAFSPDGRTLASGSSSSNNLRFWNVATRSASGPPLTVHDGSAVTVAFSPDGKTFATGGGDKTILFWDLKSRQPIGEALRGHTLNVESLAFSGDGKTLASGSWDGTVILWDVETHVPLAPPLSVQASLGQPFGQVESVAFSRDGRRLAAGGGGGAVVWDVGARAPASPVLKHPGGGVTSVAFSPDGRYLASGNGSSAGTVVLWDLDTFEPSRPPLRGQMKWIVSLAFSPDGSTLASGGGDDTIILWDITAPHRLAAMFPGYEGLTDSVAFNRDGTLVASGICVDREQVSGSQKPCVQSGIRVWDRRAGKELRVLPTGHSAQPTTLLFVDGTDSLASSTCAEGTVGSGCKNIAVQLWDIRTGRVEQSLIEDDRTDIASLVLSPDGKIVAAGSCKAAGGGSTDCGAGEIRLFEVQSRRQIGAPLIGHGRGIQDLAFSPDGQTLVSSTLDDVIFWSVSTRRPRGRPQAGSSVAFTLDGRTVAISAPPVSNAPRAITLEDTSTSQPTGEMIIGDSDVVLQMAFSPDGKLLAVSSVDVGSTASVTLWDVARRERLGRPLGLQAGRAFGLAFSPDGKTLVTGTEKRGLSAWDVNPQSWRERACAVANRNLTYDEWIQVLGEEPYRATCPMLPIDPNIVDAGRRRARSGDIAGAVAIFQRARQLIPALQLDPEKEAIRFSVEELVAHGKYLAESGDVDAGIISFQRAVKLDPRLSLDPSREARKLAAPGIVGTGEQLARQGLIAESLVAFARAREFDPALQAPGTAWNTLCWSGALRGHAGEVLDACDRAVKSDPTNGEFRTSRGVAKALTRHPEEALSDFEAFLAWAQGELQTRMGLARRQRLEAERARHERWIAELRAGREPFTRDELTLLLEDTSSQP
jgi:WD40 repeat protein/tetratricopeptide (TPR) repeat protein